MFEDLTQSLWIVRKVDGVAECRKHGIGISGTCDNAVVECLNGCGPYAMATYEPRDGLDYLLAQDGGYEIVRNGKEITFTLTGPDGPVTGSWTANDSGGANR